MRPPGTATSSADGTNADFTAASGMLTFAANDMSKTVPVQTTDDTVDESNETFTLTLSNPSADVTLATEMATGTITDNDGAPSLSVAAASGTEGRSGELHGEVVAGERASRDGGLRDCAWHGDQFCRWR